MSIQYPEEMLRGIPQDNENFITPEGYVTKAVFSFDDYNPLLREENDDFCELSINWNDDDGAIETLLDQWNPRRGTLQFLGGYCKIKRQSFRLFKEYWDNGHLSYERKPLEGNVEKNEKPNPYHGNILMSNRLSKPVKANIQATLAMLAGTAIKREESE